MFMCMDYRIIHLDRSLMSILLERFFHDQTHSRDSQAVLFHVVINQRKSGHASSCLQHCKMQSNLYMYPFFVIDNREMGHLKIDLILRGSQGIRSTHEQFRSVISTLPHAGKLQQIHLENISSCHRQFAQQQPVIKA